MGTSKAKYIDFDEKLCDFQRANNRSNIKNENNTFHINENNGLLQLSRLNQIVMRTTFSNVACTLYLDVFGK